MSLIKTLIRDDPWTAFLVVLILVIAGGRVAVRATPHFVYTRCYDTAGSYTPQSLFQSNLNSLLSDLVNASQPSYSDSVGDAPNNVVNGLFYCRGDVAPEECRGCVQAAAARAVLDCPAAKQAVIWFEECTLRYFGQADAVRDVWAAEQAPTTNTFAVTADVYDRLFDGLIKDAAYNGLSSTSRYFTAGETTVTPGLSLQGVVQCAPQMNESECEACLRTTVEVIPMCCGWQKEWVNVFRPSCLVQYRYAGAVPTSQDSPPSSSSDSSSSPSAWSLLVPNAHSAWGFIKYFLILGGAYTAFTLFYYVFIRKIKHVVALIPRWPLKDKKPECKVVVECSTHKHENSQTQAQQGEDDGNKSLSSGLSRQTISQLADFASAIGLQVPSQSDRSSIETSRSKPGSSIQTSRSEWGYPASSVQVPSHWGGGSYFYL